MTYGFSNGEQVEHPVSKHQRVMSNAMVAHTWANPRGPNDHGRSGHGNFYFEGNTLYSYGPHFPVGRIVERPRKGKLVLLNSGSYSSTTSQHQSLAASATCHLPRVMVPDPLADTRQDHRANFNALLKQAAKSMAAVKRARTHLGKTGNQDTARRHVRWAEKYARFFGYRWKISSKLKSFAEKAEKEHERAREARERRQRIEAERQAEKTDAWRRGEYHVPLVLLPVMLRRATDGKTIQTSRGAEFPTEDAVKAWPILRRLKQRGGSWHCNGGKIWLGHFSLDAVTPRGVKAGCHFVKWPEIERMARELGLEA